MNIKTEVNGSVGIATLNRPDALNALNTALLNELADALEAWDRGHDVRCMIVTGSERAFAAGADIKEMQPKSYSDMYRENLFGDQFDRIARIKKPIIAAVAGHALGGGCELALHADIIVAARNARLGQPEVRVGVMPGGGATQRLMRSVGKYRAMKLMMTGDAVTGEEAFAMGMASEVVDDSALEERAVALAAKIAAQPPMAMRLIKEVSLAGADAPLATGLLLERRCFELLFDTADQKEGMTAFAQRRPAEFSGR